MSYVMYIKFLVDLDCSKYLLYCMTTRFMENIFKSILYTIQYAMTRH